MPFAEQRDPRDHFFMQDAHLAPRFFVACPDFFADRRKFCAHLATQRGKVGRDGGYLVGQLA